MSSSSSSSRSSSIEGGSNNTSNGNTSKDNSPNPSIPVMATPDNSLNVAAELKSLNNEIRAKIVSDALKASAIGASTGLALSFLLFRRTYTSEIEIIDSNLCR